MSDEKIAKANSTAGSGPFLRAALVNALVTIGLYQLLLFSLTPEMSYAIAWAAGLALAAFVFPPMLIADARLGWQGHAAVAVIQTASFLLGLGILRAVIELTADGRLSIVPSVVATLVFTFLAMRMIFRPARPLPAVERPDN